jgi:hypothetical protein
VWKLLFPIAIGVVLFLRLPTCLTLDEFVTDDGSTFFRDQLLFGARALFHVYPEYLNVVPRVCALLAAPFPITWIPRIYSIESLLIDGLCCSAFALAAFRPVLESDAQRTLLCLIWAVALPAQELVGSMQLQWFLTIIAVPLVLLPPKSRPVPARVGLALLAGAIALTGPQPIILMPVIAVYGFRRRTLTEFQAGLVAGTLVQWAVIAKDWAPRATVGGFAAVDRQVFATLVTFTNQVGLLSLFGRRPAIAVFSHHYNGASLLLLLVLIALQTALFVRGGRVYRIKVAVFGWLIFSSLALARMRAMPYPEMSSVQPLGAHRYFYLACWCFAFLVLLAIESYGASWPDWKRCGLTVLIFSFAAVQNFRLTPRVITGWQKYVPEIQAWKTDLDTGRPHRAFAVPCYPPGWLIQFPMLEREKGPVW